MIYRWALYTYTNPKANNYPHTNWILGNDLLLCAVACRCSVAALFIYISCHANKRSQFGASQMISFDRSLANHWFGRFVSFSCGIHSTNQEIKLRIPIYWKLPSIHAHTHSPINGEPKSIRLEIVHSSIIVVRFKIHIILPFVNLWMPLY